MGCCKKSKWCFDYAVECFEEKEIYSNALDLTLNNLAYALSYNEFAERYKQRNSVLTLDLINSPLLNEIRMYTKAVENKRKELNKDKIKEFISKVKKRVI